MAALLALLPAAGHDQMWLLYVARLKLAGAALYGSQLFETNPPMVIWLSLLPEGLARLTGLPDTALGKLFMLLLEAGIGLLCLRLLRMMRPALRGPSVLWLTFCYISLFAVMPARDFGQRDHLLILFLLPYVFAAAVRAEGIPLAPRLGWVIGVLALCGTVLKPHQTLIPLAIEILLLASPRRRKLPRLPFLRPEIYAIVLSGLAFLAAIRIFAPLYFSTILPLVRDTYWAYHQLTLAQLIAASAQLHVLALIDLALLATLGWKNASPLIWFLLCAGAAATVAFYIQGTGWYYQQLPALSLLGLAFAFLVLELAHKHPAPLPRWIPPAALALVLLAVALTAHFMDYPFTPARSFPVDTPDPVFFSGLPPGTAVMTISPTIDYTVQPIFKYHLTLGQRYPAFLMLPALLRSEDPEAGKITRHLSPARLAELDALQRRFMVEDLDRWHPRLLLVERCQDSSVHCQSLEDRHDNLLAFFLRDPAFRARFAHYHYWRSAGPFDAFLRTD